MTNRRVAWGIILLGSFLSLVLTARIALQDLTVGSRAGNWIYPYVRSFGYRSIGGWGYRSVEVSLIATIVSGLLLAVPDHLFRRREWLMVMAWLLVGLGVQAFMRTMLAPYALSSVFASDRSNSFYSVTLHYDASAVVSDFQRLRASWPGHAQSNMPGKIILIYALEVMSKRPVVLAWLVVVLSNLGGVFMYLFVRDWFADPSVALSSLVLYLFVPAKLFFFPILNTVTPAFVFLCALLLVRWLRDNRLVYASFLGVALYALAFFEPTALAIGLLFAAIAIQALMRTTIAPQVIIRQGVIAVALFVATYLLMRGLLGFDLFRAFRDVAADAVAFNRNAARPYWTWVHQDPLDFFFGVGFCQTIVFWAMLAMSIHQALARGERPASAIAAVGLGLTTTLLAIDL